jgi:hypothetical protein
MTKRTSLLALALAAAMPVAAFAQSAPPARQWPTPSPEMKARMQHARDEMRTSAFSHLSPAHRAEVQAIVDQVNSGKLNDPKDAVNRIDNVLSYNEGKAIIAGFKAHMAAMHGRRGGWHPGGPPPPGAPPAPPAPPAAGAPPAMPSGGPMAIGPGGPMRGQGWHGGWRHSRHRHHRGMRTPDAGQLLLMVAVNPDRMRTLMQSMHQFRGRPGGVPGPTTHP